MTSDALSNYEDKGAGLFVKVREGEPQTLRVLTLDPLVSKDKWGNTRYSFTVWNWTLDRAQILSKGVGVLKHLQAIHLDNDFEPLNKLDVKLIATGEGIETRYSLQVLPKAKELTKAMVDEAAQLKLEERIDNGIRLSKVNAGEELPVTEVTEESGYDSFKAKGSQLKGEDTVIEDIGDGEINLDDIPF